jgi:hypothetical protein
MGAPEGLILPAPQSAAARRRSIKFARLRLTVHRHYRWAFKWTWNNAACLGRRRLSYRRMACFQGPGVDAGSGVGLRTLNVR